MTEVKRILVTGASSAIGEAIVKEAIVAGYAVDFTYRNKSLSDTLLASASDVGGGSVGESLYCDLANPGSVQSLLDAGKLDRRNYHALVHNAGVSYDSLVAHADLERARTLMEVNYWSFVALSKALVPGMCRNRVGRIVAVGSVAAFLGRRGNALYAGSKAAIAGFVRSLAAEVAPRGVTVNAVLPGPIDTGMLEKYGGDMESLAPVRRLGRPQEVAAMVRYLISPEAGFVTGGLHVVDGGLSSCLR